MECGRYGPRRVEIVFIGQDINRGLLTRELDQCLVSDSEFKAGPKCWVEQLDDPFEMLPEEVKSQGLHAGHDCSKHA